MKKNMNFVIFYAIMALVSGVFYREFTKILGYVGETKLSLIHGHYFTLGVFFILIIVLLDKECHFMNDRKSKTYLTVYHIGLNITILAFLLRGVLEVLSISMSKGFNASIAGVAGIGHILLGVSMVLMLFKIKQTCKN